MLEQVAIPPAGDLPDPGIEPASSEAPVLVSGALNIHLVDQQAFNRQP